METEVSRPAELISLLKPASAFIREGETITFWGDGMERLYGYSSREAVGRPPEALLRTRAIESVQQMTRDVEDAGFWEGKLERFRKDGERRLVDSQWIRLSDTGVDAVILEIDVDVTAILEHRQFEARLIEQAEALWSSNRELEHFAYVCSHDLREPLRTMSNFAELLRAKHGGELSPEAQHYIDTITTSAGRMADLINSLLAYSKAGRSAAPPRSVAMKPIAESIVMDWQDKLSSAGARVDVGVLPDVLAEPAHMRQLLQNLLDNALKFRSAARPLVIHISARREDHHVHFQVADNGIGLEPQYQDRVFRVFQRLHPNNRYAGTGIGLAICKKIVEGYGGRIWVESQPGQGSVFHFTLPTPTDGSSPPES